MKKILVLIVLCCSAASMNAQGFLKRMGDRAVSMGKTSVEMKADRTVYQGIDNVLSGRIFGKKKNTTKGTDETMISYINSSYGFKGKYPNSYQRADNEDGTVTFTSSKGDIDVTFVGCDVEMSVAEEYQSALDQINAEFELLESSKKADGYSVKYNMGGTIAAVRVMHKDDRSATIMVTYPEAEASGYKKLVSNIVESLTFIR